jgi:predicted aspartyl protease
MLCLHNFIAMKNVFLILLSHVAFIVTAQQNVQTEYDKAQKLLEQKDFFAVRDLVNSGASFSNFHKLVLQANLDNAFNRPASSNEKIAKAFSGFSSHINDSLKLAMLRLKHANHARLFEYAAAHQTTKQILSAPSRFLTDEEADDFRNMANIWTLLEGQPKQQVVIGQAGFVQMTRDKANLANLPINANAATIDFIFDTGANLSTVTETTAAKMGMNVLGGNIEVGSITGTTVKAKMAVCKAFALGNIVVKNAVFLVFPDDALAFPQIDYQINGIIGFPVLEAMHEIQITKADAFIIPHRVTPKSGQEMALDFLIPVIRLGDEYYTFDTGAVGTSLYPKYFEKHKAEIAGNYQETDIEFGGAGGMTSKKGYVVTFRPVINANTLSIDNVQLLTESTGEGSYHFYGNIGQDLIKQFEKMTISFSGMFIRFD